MLLFAFLSVIARVVIGVIVVFQFVHKLITGDVNNRALKLGHGLASYIYQLIQYLTFNSDYQPYPFGAWPRTEPKSVIQPPETA